MKAYKVSFSVACAFLFSYLLFLCPAVAKIEKVTSYKEIKSKVDGLLGTYSPGEILGLFEIDQVIFYASHPAFDGRNIQKYGRKLKEKMKPFSPDVRQRAMALGRIKNEPLLIEPHLPFLLKSYQKKGVPLLALIATVLGGVGNYPRVEVLLYEQLKKAGIDFSKAFPDIPEEQEIPPLRLNLTGPSLYYKGILCARSFGPMVVKGAALVAFLKAHGLHPKVIFMVDPKRVSLEDVEGHLKKYDPSIAFAGFEYDAMNQIPYQEISQEDFLKEWENYLKAAH